MDSVRPPRTARVCFLLLAWIAYADTEDADEARVKALQEAIARRGAGAAPFGRFPYCRCDTYDCSCNPYSITYTGSSPAPERRPGLTTTRHCFAVTYNGCKSKRACCKALRQRVYKLALPTSKSQATIQLPFVSCHPEQIDRGAA
ncbi:hypothetical protein VaNZ11_001578 [Volvox africanus]|uniref:Pherophorin domain-containing protein n=1 Tax=Volvox africanus TaxID=51714 RepID=A0ABQ5RQW8_9CHLO|nr:hypothetical protein VaNZ11_001578 [Volvox africanus]